MRRLRVLIKNLFMIPYRIFFTKISPMAILQDASIDPTAAISFGVKFYRSSIGKYSYIDSNSFVSDVKIGNFTSIGSRCEIGGASHPLEWVSTSPVFHKWENIMNKNFSRHEFSIFHNTKIGNDVWIGANSMIKAGVEIGNGAVVGMGSVVTKNIGDYEIWAGNPARFIRKRFDEPTLEDLKMITWWDFDDRMIEKLSPYITVPREFLKQVKSIENKN